MSPLFGAFLESCRRDPPRIAVVLGSGLGELAGRCRAEMSVPYAQAPELAATTVAGHEGKLYLGAWASRRVLVCAGRLHAYEGHSWRRICEPLAIAARLGARIVLLTNAAGGIRADLGPGNFMAVRAHLDWTRGYPWPAEATPCPYSPRLLSVLTEAARSSGIALTTGTYAQVTGPSYEARAEIRALRACGADAVGMSTAREIAWAHALGLECAALSCITNKAAGLTTKPINHEEVLATAALQRQALGRLIEAFLTLL